MNSIQLQISDAALKQIRTALNVRLFSTGGAAGTIIEAVVGKILTEMTAEPDQKVGIVKIALRAEKVGEK